MYLELEKTMNELEEVGMNIEKAADACKSIRTLFLKGGPDIETIPEAPHNYGEGDDS
jgi:hypothetical protein